MQNKKVPPSNAAAAGGGGIVVCKRSVYYYLQPLKIELFYFTGRAWSVRFETEKQKASDTRGVTVQSSSTAVYAALLHMFCIRLCVRPVFFLIVAARRNRKPMSLFFSQHEVRTIIRLYGARYFDTNGRM